MLGIKKIDIFILRKFFQLFLGCFLICLFVFMMQFVWKHIETMVGKGLGIDVLAQFFYYMALTLVPMALPMSVLLTSLLTFGNMGEQLELTAMKAAGIPLLRIMRPIFITAVLLTGVSFYFQNNVGPKAQMEMARMLFSMKNASPALEIPEGIFYNGIPSVNLYVERKNAATGMLYDVIIYKIDKGIENAQIVVADSAKLETTADKHFLKLSMFSGEQFENLQSSSSDGLMQGTHVPYDRETFQNKVLLIDFNTDFDLMNAEDLKNLADAKSLSQLTADADSMTALYDSLGRANYKELSARYLQTGSGSREDSLAAGKLAKTTDVDTLFARLNQAARLNALRDASTSVSGMVTELEWRSPVSEDGYRMVRRHEIKWHDKFASSLACLFFFFIGAPLGAIIRKGGLGVSTIVSVLIFIVYYIIGVSGMKMARDGSWNITYGMWISTFIMTPVGAFLTYKSNKDATLWGVANKLSDLFEAMGFKPARNITRKEVVIDTPDYEGDAAGLRDINQHLSEVATTQKLGRLLPNYIDLFFRPRPDNPLPDISQRLEHIIEDLSNSTDLRIIYGLNTYPSLYTKAHLSPTSNKRLNRLFGIVVPIGLALWYRSLRFRHRLQRDIKKVIAVSQYLTDRIEQQGYYKNDETT
jgi:lipopolysaccharide export system permease protein